MWKPLSSFLLLLAGVAGLALVGVGSAPPAQWLPQRHCCRRAVLRLPPATALAPPTSAAPRTEPSRAQKPISKAAVAPLRRIIHRKDGLLGREAGTRPDGSREQIRYSRYRFC